MIFEGLITIGPSVEKDEDIFMVQLHLEKTVKSKRLYFAIAGVFLTSCLGLLGELDGMEWSGSVFYYISSRYGISAPIYLVSVLSAIPYSLNYAIDKQSGYDQFIMSRMNYEKYCLGSVLTTIATAFFSVLVGYLILFLCLRSFLPVVTLDDLENIPEDCVNYYAFIQGKHKIMYFLAVFSTEAAGHAFLATIVLMLSVKIQNTFVLLSTPLMIYFGSMILTSIVKLPKYFYWFNIMSNPQGVWNNVNSPWLKLLFSIAYFLLLSLIVGAVFLRMVHKEEKR